MRQRLARHAKDCVLYEFVPLTVLTSIFNGKLHTIMSISYFLKVAVALRSIEGLFGSILRKEWNIEREWKGKQYKTL